MSYDCHYPTAATALYEALVEDSFYRTLEASSSRAAMLCYLDYSLLEAEEFGVLTMHPEQVGAAAWSKPQDAVLAGDLAEQKKAFIREHMGDAALKVYSDMCNNMHALTSTQVPADCWYLSIIGIAPEAQGRGIGKQMLEDVLRNTDTAGISTYLETFTMRNKSFYERLGYTEVAVNHEPVSDSTYTVMLRNPR